MEGKARSRPKRKQQHRSGREELIPRTSRPRPTDVLPDILRAVGHAPPASRRRGVAVLRMAAGERAAHTRKWRRASVKAHATARNAKTFARYALSKAGWRVVSLDSARGHEYKGVVDLVAVKRNNRKPDELTVMLVQVKGGSARLKRDELDRSMQSTRLVRLVWNVAEKPGKTVRFRRAIG